MTITQPSFIFLLLLFSFLLVFLLSFVGSFVAAYLLEHYMEIFRRKSGEYSGPFCALLLIYLHTEDTVHFKFGGGN